jgi:hypothetical protein
MFYLVLPTANVSVGGDAGVPNNTFKTLWPLVRMRTKATERPSLVGEF